jgi:hypothetical protein
VTWEDTVAEEVPAVVLERLRAVCRALPETREETAWVGIRWRVRTKTFAHVLVIADGHPPAYARAAGTDGPVTVLTFRSPRPELDALTNTGHPFFRPVWAPDIVGMVIGDDADWTEIAELLTESFCLLAPGKLAGRVTRPG